MTDLWRDIARSGRFAPRAAYQRLGYVCAGVLLLSGLFHGIVFLVDGGSWEGPVSWRKPVVFGLSFAITLATITWIMGFLPTRRTTGWVVVGLFAAASLAEVALITMQRWRGVASHFNEATTFDSAVFSAMGSLVSLLVLLTVLVTLFAFRGVDAPASLAWSIRLGLVLMLLSQGVGVQMIVEGGNTFGPAGALKVPHAVTLHAAQVLPALAVLLSVSRFSERRRVQTVALGAAGYALLVAATMVQTYGGRSPLELWVASSVLAVVGLATLLTSGLIALRGLAGRHGPSAELPPAAAAY